MGELKSAWQIAQERASRLGKLSAEEQKQQARQRCRQIGQVLAQKWLDGSQQPDITAELNKHEAEDRDMIKQAVIERLAEAIEFTSAEHLNEARKVIEGISSSGPELQPEAEELRNLVQEYEEAERKIRQELEGDYRETLHRLRISGTAVADINMEADPKWQLARQRLAEAFAPILNDLKRKLTIPMKS
ncbi:MAG: hypothetical protein R6V59_01675 [Dehalococcoidia bacterium]